MSQFFGKADPIGDNDETEVMDTQSPNTGTYQNSSKPLKGEDRIFNKPVKVF